MSAENDTMQVYRAQDGWRWRRVAANGDEVAESGEAYEEPSGAREAAKREAPDLDPFVFNYDPRA